MDDTIQILTLEELALIKISISLWSNESLRIYMKKQANGLVYMDEAVNLLKQKIYEFELSSALKKNLTDIFERIGYELYIFMEENILNSPNMNCFSRENFSEYTIEKLNLSDIKWNQKGEILPFDTLTFYMENHPSASPFLLFMTACEICDEKKVHEIWSKLSKDQKEQIVNTRNWSKNYFFLNYWLCLLDDNLNEFSSRYANNILTFDDRRSLHYNLFKYSIMRCFRSNISYFYSKLTNSEKAEFFEVVEVNGKNVVVLRVIQMEAFWYMKYINKYFELPIMNHKVNILILQKLSKYSFRELIDYNSQQVGKFGDLHCKIFVYLMSLAPSEVKSLVSDTLDFYVLSLIGKGKLNTVKLMLTEKIKNFLCGKITSDLKNSLNLARFSIICRNNYTNLLEEFFDLIAENDNNRLFLKSRLKAVIEGTQYDNL